MGNNINTRSGQIYSLINDLPLFTIDDLKSEEKNGNYLKVLLSRWHKKGKIVRLKKGIYVCQSYLNKAQIKNIYPSYLEFLANSLYSPSYLSLEYVLAKNNILSEAPYAFTSISTKKTNMFNNKLGSYQYQKTTKQYYTGFRTSLINGFYISIATRAKALFDFIYLRHTQLTEKKQVDELRLNISDISKNDIKQINKYINISESSKIKHIFDCLFKK